MIEPSRGISNAPCTSPSISTPPSRNGAGPLGRLGEFERGQLGRLGVVDPHAEYVTDERLRDARPPSRTRTAP